MASRFQNAVDLCNHCGRVRNIFQYLCAQNQINLVVWNRDLVATRYHVDECGPAEIQRNVKMQLLLKQRTIGLNTPTNVQNQQLTLFDVTQPLLKNLAATPEH